MTIRKKQETNKIIVDLTGQDGNAFCLIGLANDLCKKLKREAKLNYNFDNIYKDMTSGDYENLVQTFDKYFGSFVVLER
tara:strand:- start:4141 stop:4377 length:237 start_codon:yes stop_codon:yes gene_type:complete